MAAILLSFLMYQVTDSIYWAFASYVIGTLVQQVIKKREHAANLRSFIAWSHRLTTDLMYILELSILLDRLPSLTSGSSQFYESADKLEERLRFLHEDCDKYFQFSKKKGISPMVDLMLLLHAMARSKVDGHRVPEVMWDGIQESYVRQYLKNILWMTQDARVVRLSDDICSIHNRLVEAVQMRKATPSAPETISFSKLVASAKKDLEFLVPKYIDPSDSSVEDLVICLNQELA